ncbi:TIM barrel protein [Candidatus Dependentiae bacterium]|nr:TIM barrel protein [Candidatus Dependentiae bacterium]
MYKIGLKLWSTNLNYIKEAKRLFGEQIYDYIELFAVPGSFEGYIKLWKKLKIPYVIHAAHSAVGLNLAKKNFCKQNMKLTNEAKRFADELHANIIIFHPGINGEIEETVKQLNMIYDSRIIIENKPYYGIYNNVICNGSSPEEIEFITKNTNVGFCLDIGHAIYFSNAKKMNKIKCIKRFLQINPEIFHISDGDWNGIYDEHKHLGKGDFDFKKIFSILPKDFCMSVETEKCFEKSLEDFEDDVFFLKYYLNRKYSYE